jgi:hypothetical protein
MNKALQDLTHTIKRAISEHAANTMQPNPLPEGSVCDTINDLEFEQYMEPLLKLQDEFKICIDQAFLAYLNSPYTIQRRRLELNEAIKLKRRIL